jgi:hypothetical protein
MSRAANRFIVDTSIPRLLWQDGTADYAGRTYVFCSPECRDRFLADPELYL